MTPRKMKNKKCPQSLFDRQDLFAESSNLRHDKDAENLDNALAAFENGQWMQGYRLAKKTDMKDARLQYYTGCFYDEGYDFERSPEDAEMWYGEAAEQGHEEARHKLESMRKEGCCYNHKTIL